MSFYLLFIIYGNNNKNSPKKLMKSRKSSCQKILNLICQRCDISREKRLFSRISTAKGDADVSNQIFIRDKMKKLFTNLFITL